MFLNLLIKVIFDINFLLIIIFILNRSKCQEFSTEPNSDSESSDFIDTNPEDSSLANQTTNELITNEDQSNDFDTTIRNISQTIETTPPEEIEVFPIIITDIVNNNRSQPPTTTKVPIQTEVYIWISVAVVYVILVVIGLVWVLKQFCDIKQNDSIEEKRITGVVAILQKKEGKTVPNQTPEEVSQTGITLVTPSNGINESSVRTVNESTPPEQSIETNKTKLLNSENGMTSAQTTQPKLDNKLHINKTNTNSNNQVSISGNITATGANTPKKT